MRSSAISRGNAFGGLPVPESVEIFNIAASVGTLTAMRAMVPSNQIERQKGVALFIPGFTGSKEDFYTLFPYLARLGWQVWSYSQRGQGDSDGPDLAEEYTVDAGAQDAIEVARIVAQESGQSRIHLFGHSYGGLIAQAAAVKASKSAACAPATKGIFRSLTLMCSGPHGWPAREADRMQTLLKDPRDQWSIGHPTITPEGAAALGVETRFERNRSISTNRAELIGALRQLADVHDWSFELRDAHLPMMIFHGQNDFAWPQEWQQREARIVNARYEVVENAGHLPNIENPTATARLLDDYWQSVPSSV